MIAPAQTDTVREFLAREMRRYTAAGNVTKRSAVRLAIATAINKGVLPQGAKVPTEIELTSILGVSLGTVQAALQQLQQNSIIVRRRGDGTRVASTEAFGRDAWHFRLLSKKTGVPLRTSSAEVDVEIIERHGTWSDFFVDCTKFIRIRRQLNMSENIRAGADMILPYDTVPGLERIPSDELKMINIRQFLAEKFNLQIARAEHEIETIALNDLEAVRLHLLSGALAFEVIARAFVADAKPGYWQRIVVGNSGCRITF
ncbi:MAG: GntR family transcriptional regulator [Sulfitobacter sp.]